MRKGDRNSMHMYSETRGGHQSTQEAGDIGVPQRAETEECSYNKKYRRKIL